MNFYQFIVPRLNGERIEKDFEHYLLLVKKGIAGFIVFGGELNKIRSGIKELQKAADKPLIIASDLEQGLGQQIKGGTLFPPAMAIATAFRNQKPACRTGRSKVRSKKLLRDTFRAIAAEAMYAGINTIFAPVLDINSNPKNPIISTRAFGEDKETVSFFGSEMIRALQAEGIASCGKHFPGHGDTEVDSHIKLPAVRKNIKSLENLEIVPFKKAISQGVKMIMLGHLKVPSIDPSGIPASLSSKTVNYLRDKLGFRGIIITDALNMGGIGKYSEERASLMALQAGVDILLHPTNPEKVADYLSSKKPMANPYRLNKFREGLIPLPAKIKPSFKPHKKLSEELAKKTISVSGNIHIKRKPLLIILNDDIADDNGRVFLKGLKRRHSSLKHLIFRTGDDIRLNSLHKDRDVIVAVFSKIKAWKGGASVWLYEALKKLEGISNIFISFGSPYLFDGLKGDAAKIYAYWDSDSAQRAAEVF